MIGQYPPLLAHCHFTDEIVKVLIYLGMGNYKVQYPDGSIQAAHESTLVFDYDFDYDK